MKNIFKLMGIALMSCSLMVACGDDDKSTDTPDTPTPDPRPAVTTWGATFNGEALDISGYSDAQCGNNQSLGFVYLWQTAQRAEGQSVYFPYIVMWLQGEETVDVYSLELYKDTYYTSQDGTQYGDWQLEDGTANINVTALDVTTHTMSANIDATMFELGDYQEGVDTHGTLALSYSNMVFTYQQ